MAIAAIGAIAIGETGEAVTVILLFMLGEALEAYSAERARDSLRTLMSLQPQEATVLEAHSDAHDHGHEHTSEAHALRRSQGTASSHAHSKHDDHHQCDGSLRIGGRKQTAHRPAFGHSAKHRAFAAHSLHHGTHIVHPLL